MEITVNAALVEPSAFTLPFDELRFALLQGMPGDDAELSIKYP